ncbi:MAG: ComF family protein [Aquificaceae bacterium]
MHKLISTIFKTLGITEEKCVVCGGPNLPDDQGYVCEECLNLISPTCPIVYEPLPYVSSYRVYGRYEDVLRDVILCIKFNSNIPLARKLGQVISLHLWEYIKDINPDFITYPAINLRRLWTRGFNHVEELLKGASVPYMSLFKRVGLDGPSVRMRKEERYKKVQNHRLREELAGLLEGKRVLVVDDVLTTGATISRLGELLLSAGAEEVNAFFVAKE